MRRWLVFLFLVGLVSAAVDVDSYDVASQYVFLENISGSVNLTIEGEDYEESIILSSGKGVRLGDFLVDNGAEFDCLPVDCSMGYSAFPGVSEKTVSVLPYESKSVGFVLEGEDVVLENIHFNIASNFGREVDRPLSIKFFEGEEWGFSNFSDEFLPKDWGCFNRVEKAVGPLIGNSFYCEMIYLMDSKGLRVGADMEGAGGNLTMNVYPESGFGTSWECEFNPLLDDGCEIDMDAEDMVSEGNYQVCVGADSLTGYNIYEDKIGENCGFTYDNGPGESIKDYAIFAQGVKYADASAIGEVDFNWKVDLANALISDKYNGNCSGGCILPLEISGVEQDFRIYNVSLTYTDNSEWRASNLVHEFERISAKVDFNGSLELEFLGLTVSKEGEYFAEFLGKDFFRKNIKFLPAPVILSVSPMNSPAGVPVAFYANVDFEGNKSLRYEWDFGDETSEKTDVPYVVHAYNDLKNYTLTLRVSAGGNLTSEKEFAISAISPEDAVASGLKERKTALSRVRDIVKSFSAWYEADLIKLLEIDIFEDELKRLEVEQNNSFDVEDFRDVAVKLYGLNIPVIVGENRFESPFFMTDLDDVDVDAVAAISGDVSGGTNDAYANSILVWQNQNIDVLLKSRDVFVTYWNEDDSYVLSSYDVDVTSRWDRESYFVINEPFSELYFKGDAGARKAGDSTVIILGAGENKRFEFYHKGKSSGEFFVSPRLSSLIIEEDIETNCNFNGFCDEDLGEDPSNCRSDCKPTGRAIFFLIFGILFLLVVYTGLQIWYKKHYEGYLFRDATQMYNLLMFISNARARGVEDKKISSQLRAKGWSGERVDYIIKKSLGKTVGMIEIIPIEKLSAWFRDMKARKVLKVGATGAQQQNRGNINKSGMQDR